MLTKLPSILRAALLLIAAIPLLAAGHWSGGDAGKRYSGLFLFGDSLTDTGNVLALTTFLSPNLQPFPLDPYYPGRFSDGEVWAETLADLLHYPQAALSAGMTLGPDNGNVVLTGSGEEGGNNYAIAGARTDSGGSFDPFGIPTGLQAQIEWYLSRHGDIADPDALYVVLAGGNDIRAGANILDRHRRRATMRLAAKSYHDAVARLVAAGAKNILVGNSADLGQTPEARFLLMNEARATDATLAFNRALSPLFDELAARNGVRLIEVDIFRLFDAVIRDAMLRGGREFGVTEIDKPCLDVSFVFPDVVIPGAGQVSCDDALFADDHHPTANVHRILGEVAAACVSPRHLRHGTTIDDEERGRNLRRFCETKPSDYRRWGIAGRQPQPVVAYPAAWHGREAGADASHGAH